VAEGSLTIVDVRWTHSGPQARVFRGDAPVSELVALVGQRLAYRTGREVRRRCVGRSSVSSQGTTHVDCDAAPEPGQRTCTRCAIAESTFAANLHHAHTRERADIAPEFLAHLAKENVLYVAAFRDGSIKVGTSTAERADLRLAEQGAWRARIVARAGDGYAVREIEDRVTAELGVAQSVSPKRKLDGMVAPLPDERLESDLLAVVPAVHRLLTAERRLVAVDDPWSHPHSDHASWSTVHRYPLDLATGRHDLDVIDACGRIVAIRRPDHADVFVTDLQRLFGIELELGDFGSDEVAVQDRLF
jgi:hypothetical protein